MPVITDIVNQKKRKNYYSIFVNNKYLFSLFSSDLNFLQLKIDDTISEERLNDLITIYSLQKAMDYSFRLLSRKSYSEKAIKEKLESRYPDNITKKVIDKLKESNYINDDKLIYDYAKNKIELRPMGRWKLQQDLFNKKFNLDLVKKTIDRVYKEYDEEELCLKVFEKKFKNLKKCKDIKELNKIKNYLLSNGFEINTIFKIINNLKDL